MGSEMRMNYTMMGDTVNLAARLESSAKHYGVYNFVGENIYEATKDDFIFRFLDFVKVKGKNIPVKVYELVSHKNNISNENIMLVKKFEEGIDLYFQQNWKKALSKFEESKQIEDYFEARNTTPSQIYIDRCKQFQKKPPEKNWNGVWTMTSK